MPRFRSNGSELYYAKDGEGVPVVLLHCLPMDHRVWTSQVFHLSPNYMTVALDFRGLGLSEKTIAPCSMSSLVEDVVNLMAEERIPRAIVVGVSLGGSVAQQLAVDYPEKVIALVLSGTNHTSKPLALQTNFTKRIDGYSSDRAEDYYAMHLASLFSPAFSSSKEGTAIIRAYTSLSNKMNFLDIARLFEALKGLDLEEKISSIKMPTAVIAGEKDLAYDYCRAIADGIPGASFVTIEGAGHAVNMEKPIEYNVVLSKFLGKLKT